MNKYIVNEQESDKEAVIPQTLGMQQAVNKNLLEQRRVFLWGTVEDENARTIVEQLYYLSSLDLHKPIHFYINSPGGMVTAGNAIHDVMQSIPTPIYTY